MGHEGWSKLGGLLVTPENQFTSPIVKFLRDAGAMAFKHSDNFTTGVPDFSVTVGGHTTWFEVKVLKPGETFIKRLLKDKLQFFNVVALSTLGRAYYIIKVNHAMWVFHPKFLEALVDKNLSEVEREAFIAEKQVLLGLMSAIPLVGRGLRTTLDCHPIVTSNKNYAVILAIAAEE